MILFFII